MRSNIARPHLREVAKLLNSTRGEIRKASIEALAVLSRVSPAAMAFLIPKLHVLLSEEPQHAIANHAIEILHNYARTSERAARKVIPVLRTALSNLGPKGAAKVTKVLKELTQ